jgi:hypothetical protein
VEPPPPQPEGFRSEAEVKVLRILDEMEEEHDDLLLRDIGGKKCAKRQNFIYAQGFGSPSKFILEDLSKKETL